MLVVQKQIQYDMWLAFDECEKHELSATGELLPVVEPVDAADLYEVCEPATAAD